jgi:Peptidase family M23
MRLTPVHALAIAALATPWSATRGAAEPAPPRLALPLACEIGRTCEVQSYVDRDPGPGSLDFHCGRRTYQSHNGTDFRLTDMLAERAGVNVLAAAAGTVERARDGVADISIRAPGAPSVAGRECGNGVVIAHGDGWETQYCHMARGSLRVKAGDVVGAGQPLGQVGLSGNTEFPHLHLTVWHAGQVVDPFAPGPVAAGACAPQAGLWTAAATQQLEYKRGAILNTGFVSAVSGRDAIENGAIAPPSRSSGAIVVYARLIGLEAGDLVEMRLLGPDGAVLAEAHEPALDRDKAEWVSQVGRKRPAAGWASGVFTGEVLVRRGGAVVLTRRWQTAL